MLKEIFSKLIVLLISVFMISCSTGEDYYTPESVVEANAKYMNEEKYDETMNTIHKDCPSYPTSEIMIKKLFELYDLNYEIVSMKVLEDNDSEAKIEFTQITKKLNGPEFKDNKSTGIHTLKKDSDSWKIFSTKITDVQPLN
jgi:hypothetical protein